ncbi:FIST N-terminal domain-containing protein [Mameliella sediminis]|uniref:FIST N-terminal domain-containing protein n=1 Tax=Mameliella sediminis TaxID=2836866 RepID=UPI001C4762F5|nr:FIST N-terminal domain-containing protein [Mameliella sediminis]MBV7395221.1 FIST C-terminal domain-containing protein [Mameliella sediminis]
MDGGPSPSAGGVGSDAVLRTACVDSDAPDLVDQLVQALGDGPFALVLIFCGPATLFQDLVTGVQSRLGPAPVMACTTAGEIAPGAGYVEDKVVAMALPQRCFEAQVLLFKDLENLPSNELTQQTIRARAALSERAPEMTQEFAFLMVDGLSMQEDRLASALTAGLGPTQLFGGSAGDGVRFEHTFVALNGVCHEQAAVLAVVRSACRLRVFSVNHFKPTDLRMVVTRADPSRRLVHEINAEPAARELGRLLGKDPHQIDTFTFADSPMVVRLGGSHHVRAIKRVTEDGGLEFFSAIDEGLVLTLAEAEHIVDHLDEQLSALARDRAPEAILACDCVLRRIEAEKRQLKRPLDEVLARHNVTGFSTYGEQVNGMHVNQTMTGVAIYAPEFPCRET